MSVVKKCLKCGRVRPVSRGKVGKCPYCEIDTIWKTEEWRTFNKILRKIPINTLTKPLSAIQPPPSISTNTVLDDLFGGGLKRGQLVEIYGEFASGKTQFIKTCLVESKGLVVYVDSEQTFSPTRIKQIAKERGKTDEEIAGLDERILLFQPRNWKEQVAVFSQLPKIIENNGGEVDLILVDSLMVFFREEKDFLGREHLYVRQGLVRIHLANIRNLARDHDAVAIITNQVVSNPNVTMFTRSYDRKTGAGGDTVRHIPDIILFFRKAKDPKRIARLMDSVELPNMEVVFIINEKGIDNLPEPAKEEAEEEPVEEP